MDSGGATPGRTLRLGDSVEVFSGSAGRWVSAEVVGFQDERVRVRFEMDGVFYGKNLHLHACSEAGRPGTADTACAAPSRGSRASERRGSPGSRRGTAAYNDEFDADGRGQELEEADPGAWRWRSKCPSAPPDCIWNLGRVVRAIGPDVGPACNGQLVFSGTRNRYAPTHSSATHRLCVPLSAESVLKQVWIRGSEVQVAVPKNVECLNSSAFPPGLHDECVVRMNDGRAHTLRPDSGSGLGSDVASFVASRSRGEQQQREERGIEAWTVKIAFKRFAASFRLKVGNIGTESTVINEIFVGVQCELSLTVSVDEGTERRPARQTAASMVLDGADGDDGEPPRLSAKHRSVSKELSIRGRCVSIDTSQAINMPLEELVGQIQGQLDQALSRSQNWQVLLVDVANERAASEEGPHHVGESVALMPRGRYA